jgi:uncharacterized membrane protein
MVTAAAGRARTYEWIALAAVIALIVVAIAQALAFG